MSTILTGNKANVTTPLTRTVASISSGTGGVWQVSTAPTPHLFGPNDYVQLSVTIASVAVVKYGFISKIVDATTFEVAGTTYTATGTGTVVDLSLTPQIQVPTDGDSFSLQLSGMLSGLQALCDRTQALRYMQIAREMTFVSVSNSSNVPIPPWANAVLIDGCGGGGGGGGGSGGLVGTANLQRAAGGGGAGARRTQGIFLLFGATSLDVVIGGGGGGGTGSNGNAVPLAGGSGSNGGPTTITLHDGFAAGAVIATLRGGCGGGGGGSPEATSTGKPVFTPGGRGATTQFRTGPAGLFSQIAPGYRQINSLVNTSGTITGPASDWDLSVYTDPVGIMDYYEGGSSVATAGNATYSAAVSYAGATGFADEYAGGAAGSVGAAGGSFPGGAAGGGGGGGSFGVAGIGGSGGNGSTGSGATNGTAGTSAAANSGAGGGGGGGGGSCAATFTAGNGGNGGNGGSGYLNLIFMGFTPSP